MASKIKVDQIQTADGSGTIALQNQLSGMTTASMPTGSVLQMQTYEFAGTEAFTNVSWTATSIAVNITPSSASNKIYVLATVSCSHPNHGHLALYKDSSAISVGTASGSRLGTAGAMNNSGGENSFKEVTMQSLHTAGTTNQITYKVYVTTTNSGSVSAYINRTHADTNAVYGSRGVSIITVTEIKG